MWLEVGNVGSMILAKKVANYGPNMANFWPKITNLAKTGQKSPIRQF